MDELEREEIAEEEIAEEEQPDEELADEELVDEELADEDLAEEEQPPAKPEKPIKGPRFWTWLVAVLLMLFGLVLTVPALWNAVLAVPAFAGLVNEAGRKYTSALEAYSQLDTLEAGAQGIGLPGLSSGDFSMERRYVVWNRLYGPLAIVQSQPLENYFPEGTRMPRSLRGLAAQCGEIADILEGFYAQLDATAQPAQGQSESEWALAALEAARALDDKAKARALYYDAIALQIGIGDPAQKQDSLARLEALRKNPAAEPWMHEDIALYYALQDGDYAAMIPMCDARVKRNREDFPAMQYKVKALFLGGEEDKAFKTAAAYGRRAAAKTTMRLTEAELYYRKGEYGKAVALCDEVLGAVDFNAAFTTVAELAPLGPAMDAVRVKAVALLLQGSPEEARDLLDGTMEAVGAYLQYMNVDMNAYACTLLVAYTEAGDEEEAANLEAQLVYSGSVPQAVMDLRAGNTTVEKIFTEGWGGFDA